MDIVAFESRLKELWVATLGGHLGELIAPGWLVALVVPVVEHCHCYISVLSCLLKEDLRKDRHLEEEEIERAHHAALDHNRRSLRWLARKATRRAAQHLSLNSGSRSHGKVLWDSLIDSVAEIVDIHLEEEVPKHVNCVIGNLELDYALS